MKNRINGITGTQGFKAGVLIVLTLIMLIPVSMVRSLISERSSRADEVRQEISSSAGGDLRFGGPVIKIPGTRTVEKIFISDEGRKSSEIIEESFSIWLTAEELDIKINLDTEHKFKGIFYSPIFTGEISMSGNFSTAGTDSMLEDNEVLSPELAELVIPFFSQKGIRKIESASWNGTAISFQSGSRNLALTSGGIYSSIPLSGTSPDTGETMKFDFRILISGAERISILPLADSTKLDMSADWAAPSFSGLVLPDSHSITGSGFDAVWNCSSLSSGLPVRWNDATRFDDYRIASSYIETSLVSIHDHYEQNERAVKYAVLFILMPFTSLFILENFFSRRLHIIQYILAAIANIIFYLLLLSLSEHISFGLSYLISAAAVTVLICLYTWAILKKDRKAWVMAPVMVSVYTFLFMTLQSEDWALLIGSAGVFMITAFLMFITRKIDFYQSR